MTNLVELKVKGPLDDTNANESSLNQSSCATISALYNERFRDALILLAYF